MNSIEEWLIDSLIGQDIIASRDEVQTIIWFPVSPYEGYSCAVRFSSPPHLNSNVCSKIFREIQLVDNYLNIIINDEVLVERVVSTVFHDRIKYGLNNNESISWSKVIVEHTSLTPVYPINIATFRSTVIGNALASILKSYRADVSIHYLVSDKSRNIDLLLQHYSIESLFSSPLPGKSDHLCGILFCKALGNIGGFNRYDSLLTMFPFSSNASLAISSERLDYSYDDLTDYCNFCLNGHKETLSEAKILINVYDYESTALQNVNFLKFIDFEKAEMLFLSGKSSYLLSNCAYYSYLSNENVDVFSIVSSRQKDAINDSLSFLRSDIHVYPIFFSDVTYMVGNNHIIDGIKEGVFHSVDGFVKELTDRFSIDSEIAYSALKMFLLSFRASYIITIDLNTFTDIEEFVKLILYVKEELPIQKTTTKVTAFDAQLSKILIEATEIMSFNKLITTDPVIVINTNIVVNYIVRLVSYLKENFNNSSNLINADVLLASQQTLRNALEIIGIQRPKE